MSTLESLRQRSGLLVAIVGIALLAFVLTGLFENGSFFGSENVVGEINGKSIKYLDFNEKVQEAVENAKQRSGKTTLSDKEMSELVDDVWRGMINDEVMFKEYEKLGITVTADELYDNMVEHPHPYFLRYISDPNTGEVNPIFTDPNTKQLSPAKLREFVQNMGPEQEGQWKQLEELMRQLRIIEKYNTLIRKGIYVTTSQAKRLFEDENTQLDVKFTLKSYQFLFNNKVEYTEDELKDYYAMHKGEYKQEASRSIDYVVFDIVPSEEDKEEVYSSMNVVAEKLKEGDRSYSDDSIYVIAESDSRVFDETYYVKGKLSPEIDSIMFDEKPGFVYGPYTENNAVKVSKLMATKFAADSAKVRHILISYMGAGASQQVTRNKDQAKELADSLLNLLSPKATSKKGRNKKGTPKSNVSFAELVEKYSDDGGKNRPPDKEEGDDYMGKNGNYGWLNDESSFVESFKNAGLDGKKGDIVVVESQFGYHIIEVLDSKGKQKKVQVATVVREMEPSNQTMQAIFARANEFAGKNNTPELFNQAVIEQKLNKRIAEKIKENDKLIPGIESSRQLIRWMYENEQGAVSDAKELGGRYIVALLADVREKGFASFEQAKNDVIEGVIKEKKAAMIVQEFNEAMKGDATIEQIASKMQGYVSTAEGVRFKSKTIQGIGNELGFIGTISVMKEKTMSSPLVGKTGVLMCYVERVNKVPAPENYVQQQKQEVANLQMRVDYDEVFTALKENANVQEHLVKFY